jgi:hypothetical protein
MLSLSGAFVFFSVNSHRKISLVGNRILTWQLEVINLKGQE